MNRSLTMKQFLKDNVPLFIFVSVLFVIGVVFGAVMVNALSMDQRTELTRHLSSFFHAINEGADMDSQQSFSQAFSMHMKWILLIWLFGLSIIGLPLILVLDFLKGVLVGFTVGYLVGQMSWKGMLFALVAVAPQNLIVIPAILLCSVAAISFSIYMIKHRIMSRSGAIYQPFMRYTTITLAMAVCMFGAALLEGYVSQMMMKWVTPMLVAVMG